MNFRILLIASLISVLCVLGACQKGQETQSETEIADIGSLTEAQEFTVAFYNVENLFDPIDDPNTRDEDFTPEGKYHWNQKAYEGKLRNLARVLNALQADVIGLAEVENRRVLEALSSHELIRDLGYQVVHEESPDQRGIDVALLYRPETFNYQSHTNHRIQFDFEPQTRTRDFLLVEGTALNGESLYLVVNHWPSRREGQEASEPRRMQVAREVRKQTDAILADHKDACILIMGDFNDDPENRSLTEVLAAHADPTQVEDDGFYNPMASLHDPEQYGSLTYKGAWNLFDQFIISENLLKNKNPVQYIEGSAKVFNADWLRVGFGRSREAPRRAVFRGEFQEEGFSDHFPIRLNLQINP